VRAAATWGVVVTVRAVSVGLASGGP